MPGSPTKEPIQNAARPRRPGKHGRRLAIYDLQPFLQEFSPIDSVASAVLRLGRAPSRFSVFHACNNHWVQMGDVIFAMRKYGFGIRVVDEDYFAWMLAAYSREHESSDAVSGLIAYNTRNPQSSCYLGYENIFTTKALYRLGWKWPITDEAYLLSTIKKLDELDFFNDEY